MELKFPGDPDLLPAALPVSLPHLDFFNEGHDQLPGNGLQLQQFFCLFHPSGLVRRLRPLSQLPADLCQPLLQAAFFRQEVPVQLYELIFPEDSGNFIQIQVLQCLTPLFQLGG